MKKILALLLSGFICFSNLTFVIAEDNPDTETVNEVSEENEENEENEETNEISNEDERVTDEYIENEEDKKSEQITSDEINDEVIKQNADSTEATDKDHNDITIEEPSGPVEVTGDEEKEQGDIIEESFDNTDYLTYASEGGDKQMETLALINWLTVNGEITSNGYGYTFYYVNETNNKKSVHLQYNPTKRKIELTYDRMEKSKKNTITTVCYSYLIEDPNFDDVHVWVNQSYTRVDLLSVLGSFDSKFEDVTCDKYMEFGDIKYVGGMSSTYPVPTEEFPTLLNNGFREGSYYISETLKFIKISMTRLGFVNLNIGSEPDSEYDTVVKKGSLSGGISWEVRGAGEYYTLYINGTGPMPDYSSFAHAPFFSAMNTSTLSKIKRIEVGNGITRVGSKIFYGLSNVITCSLPPSIESIGQSAFYKVNMLELITLQEGLKSIENNAFSGLEKLHDLVLPDSLTTIGNTAFEGCKSINSLILPNSLTTVGNYAFQNCTSLKQVYGQNVKDLGGGAFEGCTSLKEVTLNSVINLDNYAFQNCYALEEIRMPVVAKIRSDAFKNCSNLYKLELSRALKDVYFGAFEGCSYDMVIDYYGTASDWNATYIGSSGNEALLKATINYIIPITEINGPSTMDVSIGDSKKIEITVVPSEASMDNLIWETNNAEVATVDSDGNVSGLKEGTALIRVHTADNQASRRISVNVKKVYAKTVTILFESNDIYVGDTESLVASISPDNTTDKAITWKSNNENVVTVDQDGLIKAINEGTATITATNTASGVSGTVKINVSIPPYDISYPIGQSGLDALPLPERENFVFAGWYKDKQYTTRIGGAGIGYTPSSTDEVIYSKWVSSNYYIVNAKNINKTQNEFVAIYDDSFSDANIKSDIKSGKASVLQSALNNLFEENQKQFLFDSIKAGEYKLAIYKPGYLVSINQIAASNINNEITLNLRELGDSDGNYKVDVSDLSLTSSYILSGTPITDEGTECADYNQDGVIDVSDLSLISSRILSGN